MKSPIETEIKLAVPSVAKGRALLRQLGFKIITARVFERNLVLDDERGSLRERGMLLRVRGAGKTVSCTFKGPSKPGRHKSRVENEFTASDFDCCLAVFAGIGFHEAFRYEKYRTEFGRDGEPGVATLDETPIGVYMELEGPARWIDTTAKALGFTRAAYITESYGQLYLEWCEAKGIEPSDMRFKSELYTLQTHAKLENMKSTNKTRGLSLAALSFDGAVTDILKIKPPMAKRKQAKKAK